jgi:Ubiquitin family
MRISRAFVATGLLFSCVLQCVLASAGGLNVVVTLRGKKYNLSGSSVGDLQEQLAEQAGIAKDQQSVLFKSKLLSSDDDLAAAGVSEGDTINVVPTKRPKSERAAAARSSGSSTVDKPAFPSMGGLGGLGGMGGMPGLPADMSPEEYQKVRIVLIMHHMYRVPACYVSVCIRVITQLVAAMMLLRVDSIDQAAA